MWSLFNFWQTNDRGPNMVSTEAKGYYEWAARELNLMKNMQSAQGKQETIDYLIVGLIIASRMLEDAKYYRKEQYGWAAKHKERLYPLEGWEVCNELKKMIPEDIAALQVLGVKTLEMKIAEPNGKPVPRMSRLSSRDYTIAIGYFALKGKLPFDYIVPECVIHLMNYSLKQKIDQEEISKRIQSYQLQSQTMCSTL